MNSATRTVRFGAFVTAVAVACLLLSPFGAPMKAQSSGTPALPSVTVDTTYAAPSTVVNVPSGSNLQTAINNAALGTTLMLQAGGTYGAVDLPNKSGSGWIYIVSNGILPAQGNRVQPAQAGQLAKIQVSTNAAITTSSGAHHFRFVGIEVSLTGTLTAAVVDLGNGAHHIILDRCYVHGTSSGTHRRGITLHGAHIAVVDSYVADFHENGADSQAIASWDGTGPLKIQNTYASAAGENILFGGADPSSGIGPSDIEIRGNYLFKPTSWQSSSWTIKNLLEFKNARRVLAEGNVLENNWAQAQAGFSILITPRNQDGGCSGCGTQDITFRLNSLINSQQGINISGEDDVNTSTRTARILIQDNSFGVCCVNGSDGRGFQTLHGPVDVVFERNTWPTVGTQSFHENSPIATGFVFRNNVIPDGAYGLSGTNTPSPQATLTGQFSSPVWTGNALVGASSAAYANWPGNTFPSSVANPPAGVGVNVAALTLATTCAVSGLCAGASSGDTTPPTVSITAPAVSATLSGTVTVSANASDNTGVAGVQFKANGTNIGVEDTTAPYSINWNSASLANGSYSITAVARDAAGNTATSSGVAVTISNAAADTTPPTVSMTAPAASATLAGTVTVSANASDNTGVVGVQFKANGTNIGTEDTTAPYSISWNSASVADGSYSITAVARDAAGNTATSSGVAVTVSNAGPVISATSASALTATSATITWTTNQASDSQVDFGLTTTYGSSTALDTALVTSHSQSLTGLTSATVYHYRVRSQNVQSQETISSDFTLTTAGAPVISGVGTSATTATTATIVWTTNQAADSQVEYGLTTAYGAASALNASLVTSHSQALTGLTSNQTYHYRVRSTNSFGLISISGDFTFVPVAAANISGVASSAITGSTATIAWATDIASDSQVDYGTTTAYGSSTSINTAMVTSHSQNLSGLANGTLYHYRVKSRNSQAALATSGDFTFTTVAAPSISGVAVSAITGNTATISWTTNQSADSQVDYGTTTTYGTQSALDSALVTSHSQNLAGLAAGTLYHYRVRSRNSSSLLATSADGTFTTVAAAAISGVSASAIKGNSANINWTTNQSSDSQVEYGPTTAYGSSTTLVATQVTGHTQGLSGLAQGTLYHYRVKSRNNVGLLATSGDFTFTTDAPPSITNVRVGNKNHKSATIAWNTNQTSDSVVDYGTTAAYGATTALDSTMVTGHSRLVDNLAASTTYHYRVRSTNASSLEGASSDFTFTTDSSPTQTYSVVVSTSNTATGTGAVIAPVAGITCGASCSGSVNSGTAVVFTAVPGTASRFAGWGGACSGSLVTCTVNVTGNTSVSATFAPSTTGDFDGDGFADLVWQHTDGTLALWTMQGSAQASSNYITPLVTQSGIDWQIIGPGSGSGGEDPGTGGSGGLGGFVHPTGGAGVASAVYLTAQSKIVDLGWHIVATPDLNRDGRADLLWQHSVTGKLAAWTMDGAVKTFGAFLTPDTMDPNSGWTIRTTADFNNDGKPDIVWQKTNGSLLIWFMDGLIKTGEQTLSPSSVSAQWTLAGSGDFDSDGQPDLVWQNQATGDVYLWLMNGTSMRQEQAIGQLGAGWMVRAVGDFDGDGRPDLIWQKTTGELAAWFMNGTAIKSSVVLNPGSVDPAWLIVGIK